MLLLIQKLIKGERNVIHRTHRSRAKRLNVRITGDVCSADFQDRLNCRHFHTHLSIHITYSRYGGIAK